MLTHTEFVKIYERLDINNLVDRGESFYHDLMPKVVDILDSKSRSIIVTRPCSNVISFLVYVRLGYYKI